MAGSQHPLRVEEGEGLRETERREDGSDAG